MKFLFFIRFLKPGPSGPGSSNPKFGPSSKLGPNLQSPSFRAGFIFTFFISSLFSVDFDVIVIGSSPFSLLEALYHHRIGNKVLILEQDSVCGGAWKSIDICGIEHVDLGCHLIGNDPLLLHFLEDYVGCDMVSMNNPLAPPDNNGFYLKRGCFQMIDHLLQLIKKTDIQLLSNHQVEKIFIDPLQLFATAWTKEKTFTTSKVIIPYHSDIKIVKDPAASPPANDKWKAKYYHLYVLIKDATLPRFSYQNGKISGASRMMNLTHFANLTESGKQLIVFQTSAKPQKGTDKRLIDELKNKNLIDSSAQILLSDTYVYEQAPRNYQLIPTHSRESLIFEILDTGHIQNLSKYIPKWKMVLIPYRNAMFDTLK